MNNHHILSFTNNVTTTTTRGLFHKTLWIHKLRICSYCQILTVNLLVNCQNSVIYGYFVLNYLEKSFMEQDAETKLLNGCSFCQK